MEALAVSASVEESREGPSASCQTSGSVTLDFAKQCLSKFKEPVDSMEDVEKKSCQAIELLRKRYVHNCHVLHHLSGLIL